jgi:hypothetical protein
VLPERAFLLLRLKRGPSAIIPYDAPFPVHRNMIFIRRIVVLDLVYRVDPAPVVPALLQEITKGAALCFRYYIRNGPARSEFAVFYPEGNGQASDPPP